MATRTRYLARDPHWITARKSDVCAARSQGCGRIVSAGEHVFYYPSTRSVYCVDCSPAVAARAELELADDDAYGVW